MEILDPGRVLCLPQTMWLTYRVIMERSDLSQEEILGLVTPTAMRSGTPQNGVHAARALAGLHAFGLVQQSADGLYQAPKVKDAAAFIRLLRYRLIAPPHTFGPEFEGAPDLRVGLIWLMRQSPTVPLDWDYVQSANSVKLFRNDTRWNAFPRWTQALGFGRPALTAMATGAGQKQTGVKIVPDPTEAVIDVMRHPAGPPLPRSEQIPVQQLLDFLRNELPVLPGHPSATYEGFADDPDNGMRALGLALSSAEERKVLTMTYQSDPSGVLALPDAQDYGRDRYISAVRIKG
jgi:hypothetical protein